MSTWFKCREVGQSDWVSVQCPGMGADAAVAYAFDLYHQTNCEYQGGEIEVQCPGYSESSRFQVSLRAMISFEAKLLPGPVLVNKEGMERIIFEKTLQMKRVDE